MANTTNYNWETPDDTDLVKDGAAAIRTLGSSIDTTTKALNPSTTLGDIEYRSATSNTNTRLAIGTTGQVLTVAAGVPSWATPAAGGGKVLQVVQGTRTTDSTTTSGSFVDTGLSVSITPSNTSSKVMVIVNFKAGSAHTGTQSSNLSVFNLVRTSTQLQAVTYGIDKYSASAGAFYSPLALSYLDSPSTTSATTYKVQFFAASANTTASLYADATTIASIVAMEIGA